MNEIGAFLHKASRSLDAAESSLESGHLDFAASRAYYGGCFYVAEALLLDEGLSSRGMAR